MPRIRTLKPEHRQHRKVGALDHISYRLWVGMILEADDEGRLVYDAEGLRVLIFGYHMKVSRALVERSANVLEDAGLIRRYLVDGQAYAVFPSWRDHQRIDHASPSKLPSPNDSTNAREYSSNVRESSRGIKDQGSEGIKEGKGSTASSVSDVVTWASADWPSPEALAHLYNTATPDNVPAVKSLSAQRRAKAAKMLRQFPERTWWEVAFKHYHASRFLSGRTTPTNGHAAFQPDFDWLLANGKNGTENAVKVHDGNYQ